MRRIIGYVVILTALLYFIFASNFSCFSESLKTTQDISLKGTWEYLPYNGDKLTEDMRKARWSEIKLPSNWFLLGKENYPSKLNSSQLPLASNAPGALWPVDTDYGFDYNGTVWFKKILFLDKYSSSRIILDLDMVDYYADVFVNGQHMGNHEGYFQKWSTDITEAVKTGSNEIIIKVSAPYLPFDMSQIYPVSWPKHQNQVKGIFLYHDTRPGATSWRGQERGTGGIIRDIKIRYSKGIDIDKILVSPENVSADSAKLNIQLRVKNWTNKEKNVTFKANILPFNFKKENQNLSLSKEITVKGGENVSNFTITVKKPALWWTWDTGAQNLYRLNAMLEDNTGEISSKDLTFGIRSISMNKDWVWLLNGQKLYIRGSNYISTQWLSQADTEWYKKDVSLMKNANLNAIRVHAHIERPEFYEQTDQAGILVWQDFPLQWGYTDLQSFQQEAQKQVKDMVLGFYNYPSIALWCMHNESPHAMEWMEKRDPKQNLALDNMLYKTVESLDKSRIIHRDSGTGDGHPYPGWYHGSITDPESFNFKPETPMITEYGAQALPNIETLRKMFDADNLWPDTKHDWEVWKFANFQPDQTFNVAKISMGSNINEFINNSQTYQSKVIKYITERQRQKKSSGGTGIFHFMFTEDWPSITWAVVDYYRVPKSGYSTLKTAMQPLLPSIEYEIYNSKSPISIVIINDYNKKYDNLTLKWKIGDKIKTKVINIAADSVSNVLNLGYLPEVTEGNQTLEVWLEDKSSNIISSNSLKKSDFANN